MCFDLDTGKVVTRRIIEEMPYPDLIIKRVNKWGKTTRGEKFSDGVEFRNRKIQPFDWENKELVETLQEVKEPVYLDILAEILGLVIESDFADKGGAVTTPVPPTLAGQAAAALSKAGLTQSTGVDRQITVVDGPITGVYDHTCFRTVPTAAEPNVEGITPPNPIRRRVEVEDVDSDDKDDDETNEVIHVPLVEGCNDHVDREEETEAPGLSRGRILRTPTNH